jgi:hypothetical protein
MQSESDIKRYARIEELLEEISVKHNGQPCSVAFSILVTPQLMDFDEDAVVGALLEVLYLPKPEIYRNPADGLYPDFGTILKHIKKGDQ